MEPRCPRSAEKGPVGVDRLPEKAPEWPLGRVETAYCQVAGRDPAVGDDRALVVLPSPEIQVLVRRGLDLAAALVEPLVARRPRPASHGWPGYAAPLPAPSSRSAPSSR